MNRPEAALRLWREARRVGTVETKIEHFDTLLRELERLPEGTDNAQTAEVALRLKAWLPNLAIEDALARVVDATLSGNDPAVLEEAIRYIASQRSSFVKGDPAALIFRYTLGQIQAAKTLWETLPLVDKSNLSIDALLDAGLESHSEVVQLVVQELGSLIGPGLVFAFRLKDCRAPSVALELWKSLRSGKAVTSDDHDLLDRILYSVGLNPGHPDNVDGAASSRSAAHAGGSAPQAGRSEPVDAPPWDVAGLMSDEEVVKRMGRLSSPLPAAPLPVTPLRSPSWPSRSQS